MSTGSSSSISVSRLFPFGVGPWSGTGESLPVSPPTSSTRPKPVPLPTVPAMLLAPSTNPARPIPLQPIPVPSPSDADARVLPRAVPDDAETDLADLTFRRLLADALKRREFLVTVISSGVHMILILVLALVYMPAPEKNVISLESSVDVEPIRPDLQTTPPLDLPVVAAGPLIRGASKPTAPVLAPPVLGDNLAVPKSLPSLNALAFSEAATTGGANGPDAVSFFNSMSVAKRIVFVVDASSSMGGSKFDRAKEELLTAVSNLNSRQRFYVYFFSDKDYAMLAPRSPTDMLALDTKNWEALLRWVNEQRLVGDTRPQTAMRRALALKPDVIYLLTDGDFSDDTYRYLMNVSNYRVRINTIGFQTGPESREVLEKIARKFRGEFTEVN